MRTIQLGAFVITGLIVSLGACTQKITRPTADRYSLNIVDNVPARRFDVALKSNDSRALCVSVENWPNSTGHFTVEKSDTSLQAGAELLPAKSKLVSAYCPGGCGEHRIEPQGVLRGFILYEVFGEPGKLASESPKRLIFPVTPYYCR